MTMKKSTRINIQRKRPTTIEIVVKDPNVLIKLKRWLDAQITINRLILKLGMINTLQKMTGRIHVTNAMTPSAVKDHDPVTNTTKNLGTGTGKKTLTIKKTRASKK